MNTYADGTVYLTVTETAKLVRQALKKAFPGVKFSVRSDKYAGGASIRVGWTDGPTENDVSNVARAYAGADFDGMVDLKVYAEHWLYPNGHATLARRPGTNGSFVELLGDPAGPDAQLVRFGADFVFADRRVSAEWKSEIFDLFEEMTGRQVDRDNPWGTQLPLAVDRDGELLRMVDTETESASVLVHRYTALRAR